MHLTIQPTQHPMHGSSTQPAHITWPTIMCFSMIIINSQHLSLSVELHWGNIWLTNKVHYTLDPSTMDRQAMCTIRSMFGMSLRWISTSSRKPWMKTCGLKVKMNENEDFLIANNRSVCLQTQDIAGHSYISNLFSQPFHSHATMHAVIA
jgi:hypothetical protein